MIPDNIDFHNIKPGDCIGKTIRGYVRGSNRLVLVFEDFTYLPILSGVVDNERLTGSDMSEIEDELGFVYSEIKHNLLHAGK